MHLSQYDSFAVLHTDDGDVTIDEDDILAMLSDGFRKQLRSALRQIRDAKTGTEAA